MPLAAKGNIRRRACGHNNEYHLEHNDDNDDNDHFDDLDNNDNNDNNDRDAHNVSAEPHHSHYIAGGPNHHHGAGATDDVAGNANRSRPALCNGSGRIQLGPVAAGPWAGFGRRRSCGPPPLQAAHSGQAS